MYAAAYKEQLEKEDTHNHWGEINIFLPYQGTLAGDYFRFILLLFQFYGQEYSRTT